MPSVLDAYGPESLHEGDATRMSHLYIACLRQPSCEQGCYPAVKGYRSHEFAARRTDRIPHRPAAMSHSNPIHAILADAYVPTKTAGSSGIMPAAIKISHDTNAFCRKTRRPSQPYRTPTTANSSAPRQRICSLFVLAVSSSSRGMCNDTTSKI